MKNFILVSAVLFTVFACGSAWAADVAAGGYNWTGFYAGLNVGAAMNNSKYTVTPTGVVAPAVPGAQSGDLSSSGVTGGAQLGYNFQDGNFIYGLEMDFNASSPSESTNFSGTGSLGWPVAYTLTQNLDFFGTLRGRLGFTPIDRLLL